MPSDTSRVTVKDTVRGGFRLSDLDYGNLYVVTYQKDTGMAFPVAFASRDREHARGLMADWLKRNNY